MIKADEVVEEIDTAKFMFCKIGSICSQRVQVDLRYKKIRLGGKIRIKENYWESDSQWAEVYVDKIYSDGFFFASR